MWLRNRAEARKIMDGLGYGPDKHIAVKKLDPQHCPRRGTRRCSWIDQLKQIYIDGELRNRRHHEWYPKVMRKDFAVGMVVSENGLDDPDQQFYESYVCGAERNYGGYCNPQLDELIDWQSMEPDREKRRQLVWQIERRLAEDNVRPVIFYARQATCRQSRVKGSTLMVNSIYNGSRFEDLWLDD